MSARPVRRARPQAAGPTPLSSASTTTTAMVRQRPRPVGGVTSGGTGGGGSVVSSSVTDGAAASGAGVPFSLDAYLQALNGGLSALVVIGDQQQQSDTSNPNSTSPQLQDDELANKINRTRIGFALAAAMSVNCAVLTIAQLTRIQHAASLVKIAVDPSTGSLTTKLVFSVPTRITPHEDVIQARLLQNAPRLFAPVLSVLGVRSNALVGGDQVHQGPSGVSPLLTEYLQTAVVGTGSAVSSESAEVLLALMRVFAEYEAAQNIGSERNHYLDGYARYLTKKVALSTQQQQNHLHRGGKSGGTMMSQAAVLMRQGMPLIQDIYSLTTEGGAGPVIATANGNAVTAMFNGTATSGGGSGDGGLPRFDLGTPNNYYLEEVLEALSSTGGGSPPSSTTTSTNAQNATTNSSHHHQQASPTHTNNEAGKSSSPAAASSSSTASKNPASRLLGFMKRGTSSKDVTAMGASQNNGSSPGAAAGGVNPGSSEGAGGAVVAGRTQSVHHPSSSGHTQQGGTFMNSSIVRPPQQRGGVYDSAASSAARTAQLVSAVGRGVHTNILNPILERLALAEQQGSYKGLLKECAAWRKAQGGRYRLTHGLILMNLRIGCDPPDLVKIDPCAKLECWLDPKVAQARFFSKGSEGICDALKVQYSTIQKSVVFKDCIEASIEEAKQAMIAVRRKAKRDGRVLVHYNGHGMPKVTNYGEIWFTGKDHFYPLSVADMANLVESPALYVFDCNNAGAIVSGWRAENFPNVYPRSQDILLCACGEDEVLPMNPALPADMLTCCLTTPLTIALEWFIHYSHRTLLLPNVQPEMVRRIPGDPAQRRTPLGELHTVLVTILDCIAWSTMNKEQYHKLLRNDLMVRGLYKNFFLADKLLREVGCTPVAHPPIPEAAHSHHLWDAWDVTLEAVMAQLPSLLDSNLAPNPNYIYKPTRFFADHLAAFEVAIQSGAEAYSSGIDGTGGGTGAGGQENPAPEQLPTLLLCLSQTTYRVRALLLLCRYLDTGPDAVFSALYCGVTPLITKLIGSSEMLLMLIVVWLQVVRVDPTYACNELARAKAEVNFLRFMQLKEGRFKLIQDDTEASSAATTTGNANNNTTPTTQTNPSFVSPTPLSISIPNNVPQYSSNSNNSAASPVAVVPGFPTAAQISSAPPVDPLPSFCALEGITIDRCKAISCYLLSRMMQEQKYQINRQVAAKQRQALFSNNSNASAPYQQGMGSSHRGSGHQHDPNAPPGYIPDPSIAAAAAATQFSTAVALVAAQPQPSVAISIWNTFGYSTGIQLMSSQDPNLRSWSCLFLSTLFDSFNTAKEHAAIEFAKSSGLFYPLLGDSSPVVRASCVTLLGSLIGCRIDESHCETPDDQDRRIEVDKNVMQFLIANIKDPSRSVRTEVAVAAAQCIYHYYPVVRQARELQLIDNAVSNPSNPPYFASPAGPNVSGGSSSNSGTMGADKRGSGMHSTSSSDRLSSVHQSAPSTPFNPRGSSGSVAPASSSTRPNMIVGGNGGGGTTNSSRLLHSPSRSPRGHSPRGASPLRGSRHATEPVSSLPTSPFLTLAELDGFHGKTFRLEGRNTGVMSQLSSIVPTTTNKANTSTPLQPPTSGSSTIQPSAAADTASFSSANSPTTTTVPAASAGTTGYATKDTPTITTPWCLTKLKKHHLVVMEELVHDSILTLYVLRYGCDTSVSKIVDGVVGLLTAGLRPISERVASEANVSMQGLSTASTHSLTEADRVRERRNADLMRQVVLDLPLSRDMAPIRSTPPASLTGSGQLQPTSSNSGAGHFPKVGSLPNLDTSGGGGSSHIPLSPTSAMKSPSMAGLEALAAADAAQKPYYAIQHALPIPNHNPIVAAQFRAVEKQIVMVESNNRINIVSYEGTHNTTLLESFVHSSPFYQTPAESGHAEHAIVHGALYGPPSASAVIQKCLLVNDLSDAPMLLTVDGAGVFSLYKDLLGGTPSVVSAFQAERNHGGDVDATGADLIPLLTGHNRLNPGGISSVPFPNMQCAYRAHDATLFYGSGTDGIHVVSVSEERRLQHLSTPGDGILTSIAVQGHGGTALFAGFSDGIVRYFDDRVKSGRSSLILTMETAAVGQRTIHDGVIGVGSSGENIVFVSTHKKLKIFDLRYYRDARKSIDITPPSYNSKAAAPAATSSDPAVTSRHTIASFDLCTHYPLSASMTNEGYFDFYNGAGESLILMPSIQNSAAGVNVGGVSGMYDGTRQTLYGSAPASYMTPSSPHIQQHNSTDDTGGSLGGGGGMDGASAFVSTSYLGGGGSGLFGGFNSSIQQSNNAGHADPYDNNTTNGPLTPAMTSAVSSLYGNPNPQQFHGIMQPHSAPVVGSARTVVHSGSGARPLRLKSSLIRPDAPVLAMHPMRPIAFAAGEIVTLL